MTEYVAFVRAVNVPGHGRIGMSELHDVFVTAGAGNVKTYIQSGNVVFRARVRETPGLLRNVGRMLGGKLGEEPAIMLRTARQLAGLVAKSPFARRPVDPAVKLYVAFLARRPRGGGTVPVVSAAEELEVLEVRGREAFIVSRRKNGGFYGFPNNFIEKELAVTATSRNWSTVTKLAALIEARARE